MDATLCRDHLERLLIEENDLLGKLETLLEHEHGYLAANDIDALTTAGRDRQTCMADLARVEHERQSLCRMSGKSANVKGLEELLHWCDPNGGLKTHFEECAQRAARCRQGNDRNGLIVAARIRRVEGILNIITGKPQAPAVYGPKSGYGNGRTGDATGRMIRSEA